jgi:hypothetical protein
VVKHIFSKKIDFGSNPSMPSKQDIMEKIDAEKMNEETPEKVKIFI